MNLPTLITFGRLFSVPVILWLILDGLMLAAFWVFFVAALSDAVDGIIASTSTPKPCSAPFSTRSPTRRCWFRFI